MNSVLWTVALSTHTGFQAVSETLRMAGTCFGLRGLSLVDEILIPALDEDASSLRLLVLFDREKEGAPIAITVPRP